MANKIWVFTILFNILHLVCSFPQALVDPVKCKKRNGDFPKEGSLCRSFFKCRNWIPQEMVCPEDQHFFPAEGYCVWPEEYPCLEKPQSKECPLPKGKFLKPGTKCKIYYDCCNGKPTEKKCQGNTIFDTIRGKCDWPELVTCPEEPQSKECPLPEGKFLKPGTKCKVYYDCHNGKPTEKKCKRNTIFDQSKGKCDWPELVTCPEDISTTGSTSQSLTSTSIITSSTFSTSTERKITITRRPTTPKIPTSDSDEDSSEEGNSSEESKESTTKSKIKSTPPNVSTPFSTIFDEISSTKDVFTTPSTFTEDHKETVSSTNIETTDFKISLTSSGFEFSSTIDTSPETVSSVSTGKNDLTVSEVSTSPTDEISTTNSYSDVVTEKTSPGLTDGVSYKDNDLTTTSDITDSVSYTEKDFTTTSDMTDSVSYMDKDLTTKSDNTDGISDKGKDVTTPLEVTDSVSYKDKDLTTTSGITDSVTYHIFCPHSDGYFPHPNDRHKFIACVGGTPTIMDCPANLVYDHAKRSCQYE